MCCRHPFDASKWDRIQKFLADEGVLKLKRIVEPVEATRDDLLVVCSCDLLSEHI
jgi:histone deacetylase 11